MAQVAALSARIKLSNWSVCAVGRGVPRGSYAALYSTAVTPLYFHKYSIFFKIYIDYDLNLYEMVILHK